jgi:hypothetical protein
MPYGVSHTTHPAHCCSCRETDPKVSLLGCDVRPSSPLICSPADFQPPAPMKVSAGGGVELRGGTSPPEGTIRVNSIRHDDQRRSGKRNGDHEDDRPQTAKSGGPGLGGRDLAIAASRDQPDQRPRQRNDQNYRRKNCKLALQIKGCPAPLSFGTTVGYRAVLAATLAGRQGHCGRRAVKVDL